MKLKLTNSNMLKKRAKKTIPHLTQTFSRSAPAFVEGVYPVYVKRGKGSRFIDVDGNEFLDYLLGLGPITLGYNYKKVNDAIITQLKDGILFSLPHPLEVELSELICKTIPHAEMVKFEKSGSNVVTGAIRAARAITKREKVAYCGSGGVWHDWYAISISRNEGIPTFNKDLIKIFDYNNIGGLEQIFDDNPDEIAAVVLEPTVYQKPENNFLSKVRKLTSRNNSILILDEIVTGFRFDLGGAQKYFNIKGDLVCFGKGMANGLPHAAITGTNEFMKSFDRLWVSTTNGSETLSMAGTKAVINEMKSKNTIRKCWEVGSQLFQGWNKITKKNNLDAEMIGYPIRMTLRCRDSKKEESPALKALILQEMVKRGIFMSPAASFISYSHSSEDIKQTLETLEIVCKDINKKVTGDNFKKYVEGKMPKTIYTHTIPSTKKQS